MTPSDLAQRIETIISKADKRFLGLVDDTQKRVYSSMVVLLKNLEIDQDGYLKNNAANRKMLQKAGVTFNNAISRSKYKQGLTEYVSSVSEVSEANALYFSTLAESFSPNREFIRSLQKQAIQSLESSLLNEGLAANVKQPLLNILNQNVNTGSSFSGMLDQVKDYIKGGVKEGQLLKYARTWTSDAIFSFSRAYQKAVSSDLGLEWYYYSGGVTKDSREFCYDRFDQYWQIADVEGWADLVWAGKNPNTTSSSIFIYCGGYNCRHSLIPVSDVIVPETNKDAVKLMRQARAVGSELDNRARGIAKRFGADVTKLNYKSYGSIVRKAKDDLGGHVFKNPVNDGVKDAVRTTIIPKNADLMRAAKAVENDPMTMKMKAQDFTNSSGYRGYLGNVRLSNGTIGEIQVNTAEMIYAKEKPNLAKATIGEARWNAINKRTGQPGGLGHEYYEQDRKIVISNKDSAATKADKIARKEDLQRRSREYYSKFYYSYPEKWP